jgi:hypothetical protein
MLSHVPAENDFDVCVVNDFVPVPIDTDVVDVPANAAAEAAAAVALDDAEVAESSAASAASAIASAINAKSCNEGIKLVRWPPAAIPPGFDPAS